MAVGARAFFRSMNFGDIQSKKLIIAKGLLFLILGLIAGALVVFETGEWWRWLGFLSICVWAFCRSYHFAFYVITNYVDSSFKFAGLGSALRFLLKRQRNVKK